MPVVASTRAVLVLVLVIFRSHPLGAVAGKPLEPAAVGRWTNVKNVRTGLTISYPADIFKEKAIEPEGQVLVSRDGHARLLIGGFVNETGTSVDEYRRQLLQDNYRGVEPDYAPRRKTWFVISGTVGTMTFYERVTFTCSGRFINTWAMLYPASERMFYDRIVEAIAPTFKPGTGTSGRCR